MANLSYTSGTHINSNSRIAAITCTKHGISLGQAFVVSKIVNFCKSVATMRVNLNKLDIIDIEDFIANLAIQ